MIEKIEFELKQQQLRNEKHPLHLVLLFKNVFYGFNQKGEFIGIITNDEDYRYYFNQTGCTKIHWQKMITTNSNLPADFQLYLLKHGVEASNHLVHKITSNELNINFASGMCLFDELYKNNLNWITMNESLIDLKEQLFLLIFAQQLITGFRINDFSFLALYVIKMHDILIKSERSTKKNLAILHKLNKETIRYLHENEAFQLFMLMDNFFYDNCYLQDEQRFLKPWEN